MTFFAGFVNGLFNGMEFREARDDRRIERERNATRWDWTQEDRQFQISERERVAREREEAQARAASARARAAQAQAQAQERERLDLEALNQSVDQYTTGRRAPVSIMAPQVSRAPVRAGTAQPSPQAQSATNAPRPAAESVSAIATQPAAVPQRERPRLEERMYRNDAKMGDAPRPADPAPQQTSAPTSVTSQQSPMDFDPIPSADSLRRQAEREARSAPAPHTGTPTMRAAPVSVAPTAPQPRTDAPAAQQDDVAAIASQLAQYAPPEGRTVSARAARMEEQAQAAMPAARSAAAPVRLEQQPAPEDEASRRAEEVAQGVRGALSGIGGVVGNVTDRVARGLLAAGEVGYDAAGTALSAAQMPGAGAAAYRAADRSGAIARRPGMTRRPATVSEVVMPPTQRQQEQADTVRPEVLDQARATPQQAPQTQSGTPVTSVQRIARQAVNIAPSAGQTAEETRQIRERASEQFVQEYRQREMMPIVERLLRTGRMEQAQQMQSFFDNMEVQAGMRSWARAMHAYSVNDIEGMVEAMTETYNNENYYPDGLSVVDYELVDNDSGEVVGADITFREGRSGRTFTQQVRGLNDMVAAGIGALSPEAAFEHFQSAAGSARQARTDIDYLAVREQASAELEGINGPAGAPPTAEQIDERARQIIAQVQGRGAASSIGARQVPLYR